jgi:hypothetical protein
MKKDPDRKRGKKENVIAMRFGNETANQLNAILSDNPLYTPSVILRGAVQALYSLPKEQRLQIILDAADH